jgi:transcriptional regulator with XRE-family HTH domain
LRFFPLSLSAYQQAYHLFRQRLKAARLQAGMTQVQAAKALGQPQSFISKCESGERRVDFVELQAFRNAYNVPLSFFE